MHKHDHNQEHESMLSELLSIGNVQEAKQVRRVVTVGCMVNLCLMLLKLSFGYFGHSDALMADGVHSLGDVASDIIMLIFVGFSFHKVSNRYNYGYGKFETFASLLISVVLIFLASTVVREAVESISAYRAGEELGRPDIWTVIAILFAMCSKEGLYRYYRKAGMRLRCMALVSSGWHHRTDALASFATLIGVTGAHFLGDKWRILDPLASLVIAVFIFVPAVRMLYGAFAELMEHSLKNNDVAEARKQILAVEGVKGLLSLKTRKSGPFLIFDIKVGVDGNASVRDGAEIAQKVQEALLQQFGKNIRVDVVAEPA